MQDQLTSKMGSVTLIGSGEMSSSMSQVHRMVMDKITGPVRAVFLDTPAGFQLNVDQISEKARQYFKKHFNINLAIASFKSSDLPPARIDRALAEIKTANFIFSGPGSPTYAVINWQNSPIMQALYERLKNGAHLVFASAAAIALGSYVLPVYEIYKAGKAPFWIEGLNFFAPFGCEPTIITHWNNTEGRNHDTRFCYMGKSRMDVLEDLLPSSIVILGIDEYTAVTLDFCQQQCHVVGSGSVLLRNNNREMSFASGSSFNIELLKTFGGGHLFADATGCQKNDEDFSIVEDFAWPEGSEKEEEIPSSLIDWLVMLRSQMRKEKKWDISDDIRKKLSEFGILLEDEPTKTSWRKI